MTRRVLVVGAGAIGGVTAAHLTRAGHDVVVLDANAEHVELLRFPGLRLEELDGSTSTIPLNAVSNAEDLDGRFDFALLTLKSLALPSALASLVMGSAVDTYVSLGNGLVQDLVASIVGADRLIVGLVEWGATNLGPGHLRQTTYAPIVAGELDGSTTDRLNVLRDVLASVSPGAQISPKIMGAVWSKLLLNTTFSGLGAVGDCLYSGIAKDPAGRQIALHIWTEGYDIATELGMHLGPIFGVAPHEMVIRRGEDRRTAFAALDRLMAGAGATKASMLQDLERSLRTEVDVINGGVVLSATKIGRVAPLNAEIARMIHECESGHRKRGPDSFHRLMTLVANES
jgi:2-dehydropantoate 2-reductase